MKNLFEEMGFMFDPKKHLDKMSIFNPQKSAESYKIQAYDRWIIFSHLTPQDSLFVTYDEKINSDLEYMLDEFRHVPEWLDAYKKHSDNYWDCMRFKVGKKSEFKYDILTFSKN